MNRPSFCTKNVSILHFGERSKQNRLLQPVCLLPPHSLALPFKYIAKNLFCVNVIRKAIAPSLWRNVAIKAWARGPGGGRAIKSPTLGGEDDIT